MIVDSFESCSVNSTPGGSMGCTDSDLDCLEPYCRADEPVFVTRRGCGHGTILLNGTQIIRCSLPCAEASETVEAEAMGINVTGEVGGMGLDILFVCSQNPANGYEFVAELTCTTQGGEEVVDTGAVHDCKVSSHFGHYLKGEPERFRMTIFQRLVGTRSVDPSERQLVREVADVLRNPRLNKGGGSLSTILVNNKAKESSLYDRVVGTTYKGSFPEFLRAHPDLFSLFHYSCQEIASRGLAPNIKRVDTRVYLAGADLDEVCAADQERCENQRRAEADVRSFLATVLSEGEMSQKELLKRLRTHEGFSDSLFPSHSLLMRFFARHSSTFLWISGPDQPTRIGLVKPGRQAHHLTPSMFTGSTPTVQKKRDSPAAESAKEPTTCPPVAAHEPCNRSVYRHDPYGSLPFVYCC